MLLYFDVKVVIRLFIIVLVEFVIKWMDFNSDLQKTNQYQYIVAPFKMENLTKNLYTFGM